MTGVGFGPSFAYYKKGAVILGLLYHKPLGVFGSDLQFP